MIDIQYIKMGGGKNCGIELLRVLSMLMIVSIHYWLFCFPLDKLEPLSFEWIFGTITKGVSQCSVNIYVLISAYFLCTTSFKARRVWSVVTQVFFYSVTIYLILLSHKLIQFSILDFKVFFPVLFREYWYVTEYVGLLIISPFLNMAVNKLPKKDFKKLIQVIIGLFVIYQSLFFLGGGLSLGKGMDVVWFVCLYFIGAYFRFHCNIDKISDYIRRNKYLAFLIVLLPAIWGLVAGAFSNLMIGKTMYVYDLWVYNSILVFPSSIVLFLLAFKWKCGKKLSSAIFLLGQTSFAVYLITDNRNLRYVLWSFVREHTDVNSFNIVWQYLMTIITLYLLCSIIDLFRQIIFRKIKTPEFISSKYLLLDNWLNV